jgi:hypothetical protein
MVNNSINITKTNNHLSPKESLNSDGQHNDKRRPQHMMLEIQETAITHSEWNSQGLLQSSLVGMVVSFSLLFKNV